MPGPAVPNNPERLPLEAVICTEELTSRPSRPPDYVAEVREFTALMHAMATDGADTMQKLVEVAVRLCAADSAGISILETGSEGPHFRWHAAAGAWAPYLGGNMPRDNSPCGTVVDRDTPILMRNHARHFGPPQGIDLPLIEVLLLPFHVAHKPVGTIWVIHHDERRAFDSEDLRLMKRMADCAAMAYMVHSMEELKADLEQRLRRLRANNSPA